MKLRFGATPDAERSRPFRERKENRYWWYRLKDTDYVPIVYSSLSEPEWKVMADWFDDTATRFENPGELSVPGISTLWGLIGGNGVSSVVQCGHYAGYSTLLLGFLFRKMGFKNALYSIDIDAGMTKYTQTWVDRAKLGDYTHLEVASSSEPHLPEKARAYFGRPIQMVFIDSSHMYAHTLEELDLWYEALQPGGLLVLHDVSIFAQTFDASGEGGVRKALDEWCTKNGVFALKLNNFEDGSFGPDALTYKDGCGLGIIQKPM